MPLDRERNEKESECGRIFREVREEHRQVLLKSLEKVDAELIGHALQVRRWQG
jgi:hypothetical protein